MKTAHIAIAALLLATATGALADGAGTNSVDENTYGQERIPARPVIVSAGTFPGYPGLDENAYGIDKVENPKLAGYGAISLAVGGPGFDENTWGNDRFDHNMRAFIPAPSMVGSDPRVSDNLEDSDIG